MLTRRALIASTAALAAACGPFRNSFALPGQPKRAELTWASRYFGGFRDQGVGREGTAGLMKRVAAALAADTENPDGPAKWNYTLIPRFMDLQNVQPQPKNTDEVAAWYGSLDIDLLSVNEYLAPTLAERGVIIPLDQFIAGDAPDILEAFYPFVLDAFRSNGKLLALPVDAAPQMVHFDPEYFAAQGVPPVDNSWTWRDLVQSAEKLTQRDDGGEVQRWGVMTQQFGYWWALWQNEADVTDPYTQQCRLQEPAAAEALQFCRDLMHVQRVSPLATSEDVLRLLFRNFESWPPMFYSSYRGTNSTRYRWAALPRGKVRSVPVSADMGIAIHARSPNPELAYTALKGLVGSLQQFVQVPVQKEAVARLRDFRQALPAAEVEAFQQSLEYGRAMPRERSLWDAMNAVEEGLVRGDVAGAVNAACSVLRGGG